MREVFRLVKHGVPWDVAWSLSPTRRLAYIIAAGEVDGLEWDYARHRWREKPT